MHVTLSLLLLLGVSSLYAAEPEFPLTEDSKPKPDVPKGELIKDSYSAKADSVFPGTEREYTLYLPHGFDKTKPAPFMVFQDGVIYQAPVVFDNLIAKQEIPPLVGIFVRPGVVPAANENALPRFNRSYEYDSVTDTYSRFLIEELMPAIEKKHGIQLSTDPNDAAISGNSSGGIAAFMVAWHRPDRFRRVFTGVGTYVGIHGADQLPVLLRKIEPKPLKIFLQSGTGDNNLYCGDWWMANQMMERSLTWAGYEVNHAWGEGGHNQKHASQIFPDVLRWLWKGWPENKEVKANPRGESKWRGYEVVGDGKWEMIEMNFDTHLQLASDVSGRVFVIPDQARSHYASSPLSRRLAGLPPNPEKPKSNWRRMGTQPYLNLTGGVASFASDGSIQHYEGLGTIVGAKCTVLPEGYLLSAAPSETGSGLSFMRATEGGPETLFQVNYDMFGIAIDHHGRIVIGTGQLVEVRKDYKAPPVSSPMTHQMRSLCFSPDQTLIYSCEPTSNKVHSWRLDSDGKVAHDQVFAELEKGSRITPAVNALCVDSNGWLYVATAVGIQVCDQAGRVNFIIPTPDNPIDLCFGGKDLSELFITCGGGVYKRKTNARGVVSSQMAPIKPAPPKL